MYNMRGGASAAPAAERLLSAIRGVLDPASAMLALPLDLHDGGVDVPSAVANFLQASTAVQNVSDCTRDCVYMLGLPPGSA